MESNAGKDQQMSPIKAKILEELVHEQVNELTVYILKLGVRDELEER